MTPLRAGAAAGLSVLGRRYPLCRGHGWLSHHVFPRPPVGSDGVATEVRLRSGPRVLVHTDEYVGRIVFYFGELDPRISWVCRRVLRPGDAVVDVGANYGVVSLLAAALVGPSGTVHAIEPQPRVASLLRRSAAANAFDHLHLYEVALSDADRRVELRIPAGNLGAASLSRTSASGSSVVVDVRHSGSFLSGLDLPRIRMLKLDIEGHETEFLRGGLEFLRRCPPDVIVFESNDGLYETGAPVRFWDREPVRTLRDLGYEMVRIGERLGAVAPRLTPVPRGRDVTGLDFVAVHRGMYGEVAKLLAVS